MFAFAIGGSVSVRFRVAADLPLGMDFGGPERSPAKIAAFQRAAKREIAPKFNLSSAEWQFFWGGLKPEQPEFLNYRHYSTKFRDPSERFAVFSD